LIETRLIKVEKENEEWVTNDYIKKNKSKGLKKGYWFCYPELFKIYSKLSGKEPMVLSFLILKANKFNTVKITQKEMSKKLNISLVHLKRIIKKLKQLNIIESNNGIVYLNPQIVNKGGSNAETLVIEYMPIFNKELQ